MESLIKVVLWFAKVVLTIVIALVILEGFDYVVKTIRNLRSKIRTKREFNKIVSQEKA